MPIEYRGIVVIEPDLTGKTVLVTGSSEGIGRELVLAAAGCGAAVAVHYHTSDEAASDTADDAADRGASDTAVVQGDVTDPESVDRLFDSIEDDLGTIDVLVNNVGDFAAQHWETMTFETWNRVLETNLNGTYLCSKRALPAMRRDGWGRIVNIGYASSDRQLVNPENFPYFVAKAGVLMFTRMLAADTQEDGITVNAVSPYVVESSDTFPDDLPRGRPASFEDVIQAVYFFLDDDSDYISGANVEVSGGWLPEEV